MKKIKVRVGDVFAIPLDNGELAFGQLVDNANLHCYIVFDYRSHDFPDVWEITKKPIIIIAFTVDVFIEDGSWPLLGNICPPSNIKFPKFLVDTETKTMVIDFQGRYLHEASQDEKHNLRRRSSYSPIILKKVAEFKLSDGEYLPYMEKLLYEG
jgi:hypothetical protein